jgi:hypothetical protein
MDKPIELEKGWDPDKYREYLNKKAWKESGATNSDEFFTWHKEQMKQFREDVKASGLSYGEYMIAFKTAQEQANA